MLGLTVSLKHLSAQKMKIFPKLLLGGFLTPMQTTDQMTNQNSAHSAYLSGFLFKKFKKNEMILSVPML